MKTQNLNKLTFSRATVTELNQIELSEINGGSTIVGGPTCTGCVCVTTIQTLAKNQNLLD